LPEEDSWELTQPPPSRAIKISIKDRLEAFTLITEFDEYSDNVPWTVPQAYSDFLRILNDVAEFIEIYSILDPLRDSTTNTIDVNWWEESGNYTAFLEKLSSYTIVKSITLLAPKIAGPIGFLAAFTFEVFIKGYVKSIIENISISLNNATSQLGTKLVQNALLNGNLSLELQEDANSYVRGGISKSELSSILKEKGLYDLFVNEMSAYQMMVNAGRLQQAQNVSSVDEDGTIYLESGLEPISNEAELFSAKNVVVDGATVTGSLVGKLAWLSGIIRNLAITKSGHLTVIGNSQKTINERIVNHGIIEVAEGILTFAYPQTHSGNYIARTGEMRFIVGFAYLYGRPGSTGRPILF
jgi:hypothetical protein